MLDPKRCPTCTRWVPVPPRSPRVFFLARAKKNIFSRPHKKGFFQTPPEKIIFFFGGRRFLSLPPGGGFSAFFSQRPPRKISRGTLGGAERTFKFLGTKKFLPPKKGPQKSLNRRAQKVVKPVGNPTCFLEILEKNSFAQILGRDFWGNYMGYSQNSHPFPGVKGV